MEATLPTASAISVEARSESAEAAVTSCEVWVMSTAAVWIVWTSVAT